MNGVEPRRAGRGRHVQARVLQRPARVVLHRHVGGAVAAPEAMHLDQRPVVEAGEQARLAEERLEAGAKVSAKPGDAQRDRGALPAPGQRRRHVLLDRDLAQQHVVAREVDDAEAARAEDADDLELVERACPGSRRREPAPCPARKRREPPDWWSAKKHPCRTITVQVLCTGTRRVGRRRKGVFIIGTCCPARIAEFPRPSRLARVRPAALCGSDLRHGPLSDNGAARPTRKIGQVPRTRWTKVSPARLWVRW